ncbi:MAG: biotin/lipoyl-containing protein [Planctomycetota bacterium]
MGRVGARTAMKYYVKIRECEYEVSLEERSGEVFAKLKKLGTRLDGEPGVNGEIECIERRVSYAEVDGLGQYTILDGYKSWAVSIEGAKGSNSEFSVGLAGEVFPVRIENERERAAHAAERRGSSGPKTIGAAMPGIVVSVFVKEGDVVADGTPLLILEAMKMQNEVRSESAGKVSKVFVQASNTVAAGQALMTIVHE